jgi:AraC-like DNA-binding protein
MSFRPHLYSEVMSSRTKRSVENSKMFGSGTVEQCGSTQAGICRKPSWHSRPLPIDFSQAPEQTTRAPKTCVLNQTKDPSAMQITHALEAFLDRGSLKRVYIAHGTTPPPQLAYLVEFPRLSVILSGEDDVEIEQDGKSCITKVKRGDAIFIPANSWNKQAWARRVKVLTLLFGKHQTGVSLVSLKRPGEPNAAIKAHFHRPMDGPAPSILDALTTLAAFPQRSPIDRLLVEAMLHSYLKIFRETADHSGGKGVMTFQKICLYLQENSHFPHTRYSVADHFRLSPNHISRLFRNEGLIKFVDYLTLVRLERAKYLLRHHNCKLVEIARCCGFNSLGYFCRVFKKTLKQTPSAYRMQKDSIADELRGVGNIRALTRE